MQRDLKQPHQFLRLFLCSIGNPADQYLRQCAGVEILTEILYHFNLMDMKEEVLAHAHVSTCMMPCGVYH